MVESGDLGLGVFFPSVAKLRAFSEAARLGSISRASEELRKSQSAITLAVQDLERDLKVPLFSRTRTGSYLTDMGQILHRRVEAYFSRMEAGVREVTQGSSAASASSAAIARRLTRSQILAILALHEHGSFSQAARYVEITPTSMHRSARGLEGLVGKKLFKKTLQGTTTNEAGAALSKHFRLAIRELEWAEDEIRSQKGALQGRLLVGSLMLAGSYFISVGVIEFLKQHPKVKINLLNGNYDVLLSKLRSGSVDILTGILKGPPPTDDVVEEILGYDPYVIAVGKQHPLARKRHVTLKDLRSAEWILPQTIAHRRRVFDRLFDRSSPRYNVETHSLATILLMLVSGERMAISTRSELSFDQRLGKQLAELDFKVEEPPAALGLTYRRDWKPTKLQQTFLDALRAHAKVLLTQKRDG